MNQQDSFDGTMWVESIRSDGVILSNGEYEVEVRVSSTRDRERDLPALFRRLTIEDTVHISFETQLEPPADDA